MNDKMMKLLMSKKKKGQELSDSDKKPKMEALKGMRDMAHSMMGDKLKNLKKVVVASDSKEGVKAGLHKAEDMMDEDTPAYASGGKVPSMPEEFDTDEQHEKEEAEDDLSAGGMPSGEEDEDESIDSMVDEAPHDADKLQELIDKLEAKKQSLK